MSLKGVEGAQTWVARKEEWTSKGRGNRGEYHQNELYKLFKELIKEREIIDADVEHKRSGVSNYFKREATLRTHCSLLALLPFTLPGTLASAVLVPLVMLNSPSIHCQYNRSKLQAASFCSQRPVVWQANSLKGRNQPWRLRAFPASLRILAPGLQLLRLPPNASRVLCCVTLQLLGFVHQAVTFTATGFCPRDANVITECHWTSGHVCVPFKYHLQTHVAVMFQKDTSCCFSFPVSILFVCLLFVVGVESRFLHIYKKKENHSSWPCGPT